MQPQNARNLALLAGFFLIASGVHAAPCPASATVMCLAGQRFAVEVRWKDFEGHTGQGQAVGLTPDTGYFWFFSDNNVELVVKVLDARGFNNHFWVFFGALSNVEYTLKVTDTATGATRSYQNPSGQFASVGDTAAFPGATAGVAATHETVTVEGTPAPPESLEAIQRSIDAAATKSISAAPKKAAAPASCPESVTGLYLSNCRFLLEAHWTDSQGRTGAGQAVPLTNDTGYFWFFTDNNVELVVKVLDARAFNGSFWVFYGALSNVEYSLHVTDTISGALHIYRNPSGAFASVGDTAAFRGGFGVVPSPDSGRAVSGAVTAAGGGTLSATAANGTVFTLDVPPDALLSDRTITMTPVASIGSLPFSGGFVAGVNLEPSGLFLMKGARLTIKTSSPIPPAEETTFAWNGTGEDFFLYPPVAANGDLQMSVIHLGGYGVGRGTEGERQIEAGRDPVGDDDRLSHRIALLLREGRAEAQNGSAVTALRVDAPKDWRASTRKIFDDIYSDIRDQMQGTLGYPDQVMKLVDQMLTWEVSLIDKLGPVDKVFPGRSAEIKMLFERILRKAFEVIHARCVTDVTQIKSLPQMLRIAQALEINLQDAADAALRCLNFQLQFDSTIVANVKVTHPKAKLDVSITYAVSATVPLRYESSGAIGGTGTTEVRNLSVTGVPKPCSAIPNSAPGGFVAELELASDLEKINGLGGIRLHYGPGFPITTVTIICPDEEPFPLPLSWGFYYLGIFHADEAGLGGGLFTASGWKVPGGTSPWATKSYGQIQVIPDGKVSEITIMRIDHTPQ